MSERQLIPEAFRQAVTRELAPEGWVPARFTAPGVLEFVLPLGGGFSAVGSVHRLSRGVVLLGPGMGQPGPPGDWYAMVGAGYQPALDLAPRLTLQPRHALLSEPSAVSWPEDGSDDDATHGGAGFETLVATAVQVVRSAGDYARDLASTASMESALRSEARRFPGELDHGLVLFLSATDRTGEALEETARVLALTPPEDLEVDDARFARQLRRWVERGCPAPPPLEQWPEVMFEPPAARERPSREARQKRDRLYDQARDAVRAQSAGKSREQVMHLVTSERVSRGLDSDPASAAMIADMVLLEHQPFGKLRAGVIGLKTLGGLTKGWVDRLRAPNEHVRWPKPPGDALFPVPSEHDQGSAVEILPEATGWLEITMRQDGTSRFTVAHGDVWLTRHDLSDGGDPDAGGEVTVVIGDRLVGRLTTDGAHIFEDAFQAAGCFDEHPMIRATFMSYEGYQSLKVDHPCTIHQPPRF